jgi:outer membrane immunogenic protein
MNFHLTAITTTAIVIGFMATGVANAADMPSKVMPVKAPMITAPVFNWNGFYAGGHIGGGWFDSTVTNVGAINSANFPYGTTHSTSGDGFLGGVQAGFNWQFHPTWLIGIEGDFSWAGIKGSSADTSTVDDRFISYPSSKFDQLATVAARLGFVAGDWLFYAKGGWAWAHYDIDGYTTRLGVLNLTQTGSGDRSGWVAGAGIEYGFLRNWSVKVEYDYLDLGKDTLASTVTLGNGSIPTGSVLLRDHDTHLHIVKAGFSYHLN